MCVANEPLWEDGDGRRIVINVLHPQSVGSVSLDKVVVINVPWRQARLAEAGSCRARIVSLPLAE